MKWYNFKGPLGERFEYRIFDNQKKNRGKNAKGY